MPASKNAHKWSQFIADEFNIPEECLWVTSLHNERTFVYIWTEKLSKKDYERISGAKSGGGHLSTRGKLSRFLSDLNADGWFTKVKPSEAKLKDLHPITPNVGCISMPFCKTCGESVFTADEVRAQKCNNCYKVAKI